MNPFQNILIWATVAVIAYGILGGVLALRAIFVDRDKSYRLKREEFLDLKRQAEKQIKKRDKDEK